MAVDTRFVLSPPLNQWMVDRNTGLALAEGTITFYRDSARNTPKPVYQLTGIPPNYSFVEVIDPITLSSVGTLQNAAGDNIAIYFYPYVGVPDDESTLEDLYYIVCRNSNGTVMWTREAWPAGAGGLIPVQTGESSLENQISNPQFVKMLLNEGFTTTFTQADANEIVYPIAPGWDMVVTGALGTTVQVSRVEIDGSDNVRTNPPYALDVVTSAGIVSCRLRQRFDVNSGLWASTVQGSTAIANYLAASITGIAFTTDQQVDVIYKDSFGNPEVTLLSAELITANYKTFNDTNNAAIPASTNTSSGVNAYIDIFVSIPTAAHVRITSIQVLPIGTPDVVSYDLQSSDRQVAYMGDYYLPRLEAKQVSSLLTGWDFPLNPAQWGGTGTLLSTAAPASYIWDQTIAIDTAGSVTYARNADTGGLQFTTVTGAANAIAMVQFLSGAQVKKILGTKLSVNVFGYRTTAGSDVVMRVYLYRGTNAANFPSLASNQFIATLATSGVLSSPFTGWAEIPRNNLDTAKATLSTISTLAGINNAANDYGFSQWGITNATQIDDTEKFAIAVTFAYTTAANVITVNSVSVVPGDIPCRPATKTANQTLFECQPYYQKSFRPEIPPQQNVNTNPANAGGAIYAIQSSAATVAGNCQIIRFTCSMVDIPTVVTYNPAAANAEIQNQFTASSFTLTAASTINQLGFNLIGTPPVGSNVGDFIYVHYSADARLGK